MPFPVLTWIVFTPLIAAVILLFLPGKPVEVPRKAAFGLSLVPFVLSLTLLGMFDASSGQLQLVEKASWIPALGVNYSMAVDGFSLWLIVLTTFLTPIIFLAAWGDVEERVKEYFILMLLLEFGMLGCLTATDLFLFFLFWELMLFPMILIIAIWGGPNRRYASVKFLLYTMAGSALMLVGMIYLVYRHKALAGLMTFDLPTLYALAPKLTSGEQTLLFWSFALAFMIKVPMVPFHTWLPDAHTEAPTGGSVALAGVLLKLGTYGFLRIAMPLFPVAAQEAFPLIVTLAVIGIVHGALVAFPQPDMKRLVAYSSVSHLGFVMLGLFAFNTPGISGALIQMVNHGLSTGALFLMIGMIYHQRHTREIAVYGGLWGLVPVFSSLFLIVTLSSIGLPGLNGFVGEFLIMLGAFRAHPVAGGLATLGVILGAVYMLTMFKRVIFGPVTHEENRHLHDLSGRELAVIVPMLAMIFWIGIYPKPFLSRIEPTVEVFLARMKKGGATEYLAETPAAVAPGSGVAVAQR